MVMSAIWPSSLFFLSTLYAVISQATAEQRKQNNVHNKNTAMSGTDIQCPEGTGNLGSSHITPGIKKNGTTMAECRAKRKENIVKDVI
jgi:hypothetical protein